MPEGKIRIASVDVAVYRAPLEVPVETSFGIMRDRPMVLVRAESTEGVTGVGEIWCNFPQVGAEHRARLVKSVLAPILCEKSYASPGEAFGHLTGRVAVLELQSGERGPFSNAIAGLDVALWDLAARTEGLPLWRVLGGRDDAQATVPVYASGLNPSEPEKLAAEKYREGFRAFKLKIGFGAERDKRNLQAVREVIGDQCSLAVDANQAWDMETALSQISWLESHDLLWLEEPLRSDRPVEEWQMLKAKSAIPLAAGENFLFEERFDEALAAGYLDVVQPDLAKWGGLSRCVPVARRVLAAGRTYCPHYLGGGVGLLASAHALKAVGGQGILEVDANPNPLRSLITDHLMMDAGQMNMPDRPGLGIDGELEELEEFRIRNWSD